MSKKTLFFLSFALLGTISLWAQGGGQGGQGGGQGGPGPGGQPGGGGAPAPSTGGTTQPGQGRTRDPFGTGREQQQMPQMRQPVFLSGKVILEDGTPPPEPVTIERVCDGRPIPEGYTDSKGHFSFQLGNNAGVFSDASVSGAGGAGMPGGFGNANDPFSSGGGLGGFGQSGALGQVNLMGCELRAVLAGFISESLQLGRRSVFDKPDVGTIILKRLGNVEGTSISFTTLAAPKDAKKAYENAFKEVNKPQPNFQKAEKEIDKAVAVYPQYAAAWNLLGRVRLAGQNNDGARTAFEKAIEADEKYLNPYEPLVRIALQEERWEDAAKISSRVLQLNPTATEIQYFHAVAAFNKGDIEGAEKSAQSVREARDSQKYPGAQHLMGMILAKKGKFEPAANEFRAFLMSQPNSPAASAVRRQLTEWEALGVIKTAGIASSSTP